MVNSEAEKEKDIGNQAFAKKEYDEAITHYTEAIRLSGAAGDNNNNNDDNNNDNNDDGRHVYYSNRSACHAGLAQWEDAATDARRCLEHDAGFIKGYYRLTTALVELGQWDEAHQTVKAGLRRDVDNTQLLRQQRTIRANKASQRAQAKRLQQQQQQKRHTTNNNVNVNVTSGAAMTDPANQEVLDLQQQFVETSRECNLVKANITKSQREQKINSITISELESMPSSKDVKMYRGIGKMFMLSERDEIMSHLNNGMEEEKKQEADMQSKVNYLERRIKSQQANIQDLIRSH